MMYCKCDNCGKEAEAFHNGREWFKPTIWFEKIIPAQGNIQTKTVHVCSRECITGPEEKRSQEKAKELPADIREMTRLVEELDKGERAEEVH